MWAQFAAADFTPDVKMHEIKGFMRSVLYFDDSPNVIVLKSSSAIASFDDGTTWSDIEVMKGYTVNSLKFDPLVKLRAYAFSSGPEAFVTNDKGKNWRKFVVRDSKGTPLQDYALVTVNVNVADTKMAIFQFRTCSDYYGTQCTTHNYYTTDGLKSDLKVLTEDAESCIFAMSNKDFANLDKPSTIVCSRVKLNSFGHVTESLLVKTTDFFKSESKIDHPALRSGKIIDLRVELSFMIAVVQTDKFNIKSLVAVLISKDAKNFDSADLEFLVSSGAIFFLEANPLSLFLSVGVGLRKGRVTLATIYSSDSTGLRFTKLIEDVAFGETTKLDNVDGVWFTSVLTEKAGESDEPSTVDDFFTPRNLNRASKISVDNGRSWNDLELLGDDSCKLKDGCSLHVIGVNAFDSEGDYVTGPTPNLLVASGTTGKHLGPFAKFKTYVSRDGGLTWKLALHDPAVISYGDQGNIIIALPASFKDMTPTEKCLFSLDQGTTWSEFKLEKPFFPLLVVTTIDGTGKKFIVLGLLPSLDVHNAKDIMYVLDFAGAFGGVKCDKDKDFEKIYARVADNSERLCIYGHTESFMRRKADAKCYVSTLFEDIKVTEDPCECTEHDFECSPYFKMSPKGECVPDNSKINELCSQKKSATVKVSNKQLAAGNLCKTDPSKFITTEELKCKEFNGGDQITNKVSTKVSEFEGLLSQYSYVQTNDELADNIIFRTTDGVVYASNNGGQSFVRVKVSEPVIGFLVGPSHGSVLLLTAGDFAYYSEDGGNAFTKIQAPGIPTVSVRPISFHPSDSAKFIWFAGDCGKSGSSECAAYYTEDSGKTFHKLVDNAVACDYVSSVFNLAGTELIYCTVQTGSQKNLISSTNFFKEKEPKVLFENIVSYAVRNGFVIVATIDPSLQELRAKVTVDGTVFAAADFPSDFKVEAQTSYAILDSNSHSIFMHVTTVKDVGHERGAILKSNSNGTSYVLALNDVNRNSHGYVDYDRMEGIEGVLLANTVSNPDSSDIKKLKTQISFNDGSQWSFLPPPQVDSNGKKYPCSGKPLSKCSLNLHGFTERPDYRDTYSSSSAIGLLIGTGNVGETLESHEKASTFLSTDGGLTWKEVAKGVHQWEYGDQGTILVLVPYSKATTELIFSTDEGTSWQTYKFSEKPVAVLDLATIPTDTARKFVIFTSSEDDLSKFQVHSIDFTHYFARQCALDLENPDKDDYEYWTPVHPESSEGCLFGHEAKFLRRAKGHNDCFIGAAPLEKGYKVMKNCTCTRSDYECDYNYFRDEDGTCKLVKGLSPADHKAAMCKIPDTFQYFEPTGYRKIPLSTCVGGKSFDAFDPRPCPGHEKEFNEYYGRNMGGGKILLVVLIPLFVFVAATWFVYDRGIRRNGGFKQFGLIRLDEDDDFNPIEDNFMDVVVNRVVRGGIIVVAGTIAVFKTLRRIDRAMMERLTSSLFGRRPGRRNYVRVPDDEDELFGNFDSNYDDELEDGAHVDFEVQDEPEQFTDYNDHPPVEADARLFDIDEQSDDGRSSENVQGERAESS